MTEAPSDAPAKPRYSYETPWQMYSLAWALRPQQPVRLAVGSYLETEANKLQVLEVNPETQRLEVLAQADHPFIGTKLMWSPRGPEGDSGQDGSSAAQLLASTSTTLNIWRLEGSELKCVTKLANARTRGPGGHSPPLTSFDWSAVSHHKIGASSVDSTCTIWNLERQKIETQLIAHDKAVHDIVFSQKDCLFASVGADGSVRLFDQRNLDHSTIIYESANNAPLLRLAWNRVNKYHIATVAMDDPGVILIDIRRPSVALNTLSHHEACVNSIQWSPQSANHLLCGADDGSAMVWDVEKKTDPKSDDQQSVYWHDCGSEVNNVVWPSSSPEMVGLGMSNRVDIMEL